MDDAGDKDVTDPNAKAAIGAALADVEEGTKWSAQGQFEQAKLWRAAHLTLGVPAAALAAIAGATALASTTGRVAAGIIALVSAGLSAVASSLDAAGRAESAQTSGNRYLAVRPQRAWRARSICPCRTSLRRGRRSAN